VHLPILIIFLVRLIQSYFHRLIHVEIPSLARAICKEYIIILSHHDGFKANIILPVANDSTHKALLPTLNLSKAFL